MGSIFGGSGHTGHTVGGYTGDLTGGAIYANTLSDEQVNFL